MPPAAEPNFVAVDWFLGQWLYRLEVPGGLDLNTVFVPESDPAGDPQRASRLNMSAALGSGWVVFCGEPPVDADRFIAGLRALRPGWAPPGTGLLWIDRPDAGPAAWRMTVLPAVGTLVAPVPFGLANLTLTFPTGARVWPGDPGTVQLQTRGHAAALSSAGGGQATLAFDHALIHLSGPAIGCFEVPLDLGAALDTGAALGIGAALATGGGRDTGGGRVADLLDLGLRYSYPVPGAPGGGTSAIASAGFPVFELPPRPLPGTLLLDPLRPDDPDRTAFRFPVGLDVPSWFRTPLGRSVTLRTTETSRLVFARRAPGAGSPGDGAVYAHPEGRFAVEGSADRLLCGLAGNEYLDFDGEPPAALDFVAGGAAHATGFLLDGGRPDDPARAAGRLLSTLTTTAWVRAVPARRARYFSQPESGPWYAPGGERPESVRLQPEVAPGLLWYLPLVVGTTGGDGRADALALPLVPHAGVPADPPGGHARLEASVIQPARRQEVERAAVGAAAAAATAAGPTTTGAAGPPMRAATPGGMIATFSADGAQWLDVELGRSPGPAGPQVLALHRVGDDAVLRSALLDNQQFLVISDPDVARRHLDRDAAGGAALTVAGWTFDLDPERWAAAGTVLVVKHAPRAFSELLADLGDWTNAAAFNARPADTQGRLGQLVAEARVLASADGDAGAAYRRLVDQVLDDPAWNGTLVFACPVDLPAGLGGITAGIDLARLAAHHVAIEQTPVDAAGLTGRDSSLLAALRYTDDRPLLEPGWALAVRRLDASFHNSRLTGFSAVLEVQLGSLFGADLSPASPAASASGDGQANGDANGRAGGQADGPGAVAPGTAARLTLDGTYQSDAGVDRYLFALRSPSRFATGGPLDWLRIDEVAVSSVDGPGNAHLRLQLRGVLHFVAHQFTDAGRRITCDLLSYDELAFAGLRVDLPTSRTEAGGTAGPGTGNAPGGTAAADLEGLRLDAPTSRARAGSLVDRLPLQLVGLRRAAADGSPKKLGYLPLTTPVSGGAVSGDGWYGLEFRLDLGSAGALSDIPGLAASLLVAWTPTGATSAGLRLSGPGGGNAAELAIQSVLKLKIKAGVLWPAEQTFVLMLTGVTISLLALKLPLGGTVNLALFGDPQGGAADLAWYGAWTGT